jgi:small subunit ribosomal protein S2
MYELLCGEYKPLRSTKFFVVGVVGATGLTNCLATNRSGLMRSALKPKKESAAMAVVTMRELLDSGVHFGHQTRRWNPKMKRFIFTERNGIYIIDIQQSLALIDQAYEFVKDTVAKGGHVLFVGTKKQAHEPIMQQAARVGMPTVTERWLGGMLTNFPTVYKRIQRLKELEALENANDLLLTKKELLVLRREREKLFKNLDGIRHMTKLPSAIWVVDTKKEHLAVQEAKKLGIPVIAILDTNCDPDEVDFKIPGNDDAIRSIGLLTRVITDAIVEGMKARAASAPAAPAAVEAAVSEQLTNELLSAVPADAVTKDAVLESTPEA